ncbi:tyrosine-type recombinase/integrase [Calditrichota bacterium]
MAQENSNQNPRIKTDYVGVYYRLVDRVGDPKKHTSGIKTGNNASRKEKVYYIRFKHTGKVIEEKVGKQSEDMTPARAAQRRADRIRGKVESRQEKRTRLAKEAKEEESKWTVDRIWDLYCEIKGDSVKRLKIDKYRYESKIEPYFGNKEPSELKPVDFDRWRIKLEKEKLSPASVHSYMALMRRLLRFAGKRALCAVPDYYGELPTVDNIKDDSLNPQQIASLLKQLQQEDSKGDHNRKVADMMRLALFTGLRRGEIFGLRWEDVDFDHNLIWLSNPKGGKSVSIPMSNSAYQIIQRQKKTDSEYIFPGRDGGKVDNVARTVRRIRDEAGLPETTRPFHSLRHTFASVLASSGQLDMYTLQRLLTHKSPQMTQRYAHLRDETLKQGADLAGVLINSSSTVSIKGK